MLVAEGDRVPADAVLLSCSDLQADESLLTGESVPVRKMPRESLATEESVRVRPGGDDLPNIFSGTLIVQGQGIAEVTATGPRTEMGLIGWLWREPSRSRPSSSATVRAWCGTWPSWGCSCAFWWWSSMG